MRGGVDDKIRGHMMNDLVTIEGLKVFSGAVRQMTPFGVINRSG